MNSISSHLALSHFSLMPFYLRKRKQKQIKHIIVTEVTELEHRINHYEEHS